MLFPPKEIIGIDIGNYAVKLVCFVEDKKIITLKDWGVIPLSIKADTPPDEKKAIISGEIKNYLRKKGIEAGANAYITKPSFDQKVLLDTIRRLI